MKGRWWSAGAISLLMLAGAGSRGAETPSEWKAGPLERKSAGCYYSVMFTPDGSRFVTLAGTSEPKDFSLWVEQHDGVSGALLDTIAEPRCRSGSDLLITPDGGHALYAFIEEVTPVMSRSRLRLVDLKSGKARDSEPMPGTIQRMAMSADGETALALLQAQDLNQFEMEVHVWDLSTLRVKRKLLKTKSLVNSIALSPDGKYAAAGVMDKGETAYLIRTTVWDPTTGEVRRTFRGGEGQFATILAFSPDSRRLALSGQPTSAANEVETVEVRALDTGKTVRTYLIPAGNGGSAVFSPDGQTLAAISTLARGEPKRARDGVLTLWRTATGDQVHHSVTPDFLMRSHAFSRDGRRLAVAGYRVGDDGPSEGLRRLYTREPVGPSK